VTARGADRLVAALAERGVHQLFSLSGNQILSIYDATIGRDMRIIHTRHEAAAVHMADAWGRLGEEPGVALVTAGPGHLNALSALYGARMAESPLVLLSGHAPAGQAGREVAREHRVDGGPAGAHRVGVADTLRAVLVAQLDRDQLEALDHAVGAVGERHRQRDPIVAGPHLAQAHQAVARTILPNWPASSMRRCAAAASPSGKTRSTTGRSPSRS